MRVLVYTADGEDERELQVVYTAFQRLIRRAQEVAVTEVVGQPALFEAHCKERAKKPGKLFNSCIDQTTFRAYIGY